MSSLYVIGFVICFFILYVVSSKISLEKGEKMDWFAWSFIVFSSLIWPLTAALFVILVMFDSKQKKLDADSKE
jgi:hypothetical protein